MKTTAFDQYRAITHPMLFAAKIVSSAIHGTYISRGDDYHALLAKYARESGTFDAVLVEHKVKLDRLVGTRLTHIVDIVCITDSTVDMYNVKSRAIEGTHDFGLTVQTYLAARESMQRQHPDKTVEYRILRIGGEPIEEFDRVGVTTQDASAWATKMCGQPIDIESDSMIEAITLEKIERKIKAKCEELGLPSSVAESMLNMLATMGNDCGAYAPNLQVQRWKTP